MAVQSKVYIAGVGISSSRAGKSASTSNETNQQESLISAATKALLEAGLSYDHITHGVIRTSTTHKTTETGPFKILNDNHNEADIPIDQAKDGNDGLLQSYDLVRNRGVQCVLLISCQNSSAISLILISEDRLWRHPYLKDTAVELDEVDDRSSSSSDSDSNRLEEDLRDFCEKVWMLRGWTTPQSKAKSGDEGKTCCRISLKHCLKLSRADGKEIPKWKDIEHKQDGRDRLGFNPAVERDREITQEDFEGVLATRSNGRGKGISRRVEFGRRGGDRALLAKL